MLKSLDLPQQLSASARELLLVLVDTAKQAETQTVLYREVRVRQEFERGANPTGPPDQDPLGSLQQLGLVDRLSQHHIYLRAAAFERAAYERKSWLGKWWLKMTI